MTSSRAVSRTLIERRDRRSSSCDDRRGARRVCRGRSASCRRSISTTSAGRSCSRRSLIFRSTISRALSGRFSSLARTRSMSITGARTLVELGAGSAAKTRILLAAMRSHALGVTYVPVDVSEEFPRQTGRALQRELPSLLVEPVVSDISVVPRSSARASRARALRISRQHDRKFRRRERRGAPSPSAVAHAKRRPAVAWD